MSVDDQESREKRDQSSAPEQEASGDDSIAAGREEDVAADSSGERPRPGTGEADEETADRQEDSPAASEDSNGKTNEQAPAESGSDISGDKGSSEPGGVENTVALGTLPNSAEDVAESAPEQDIVPQEELRPTTSYYDDPHSDDYDYQRDDPHADAAKQTALTKAPPPPPPPPPPASGDFDSGDDDGMTRMSFLEHLEELRTRILRAVYGLGIIYLGCLVYATELYGVIAGPFKRAVENLPYDPPIRLVAITPMEQFHLIYIKIPLLVSIFLASPWLMYQAWAFIAPGLFRRERRWALPFICSTAVLFVVGGVFGYVVALRYALAFLISIGLEQDILPMISIDSYLNLFIGVMLGLGLVFQMPIVIFFLTLMKIVTPQFLVRNMRYAILIIFIIAAIITPTPDVINLILFAGPMILLFYVGIAASYVLTLHRESRKLPWGRLLLLVLVILALAAGAAYLMHAQLGFQLVDHFPWLVPPQPSAP